MRWAQGVKFLSDCEFIAIFDADFKPEPDFLHRTVPYLVRWQWPWPLRHAAQRRV